MAADPPPGPALVDVDLRAEIELYGELVVAASASQGPMSLPEIDHVLGLDAPVRQTEAPGA